MYGIASKQTMAGGKQIKNPKRKNKQRIQKSGKHAKDLNRGEPPQCRHIGQKKIETGEIRFY